MRCLAFALLACTSLFAAAQPAGVGKPAAAPPAAAAPATPAAATQDGAQVPAEPAATSEFITGPLRIEVFGVLDLRRWFAVPPKQGGESELQLQMRIAGEKLTEICRAGQPIFTEGVDDTGQSILKPEGYTDQQRTQTSRVTASPEVLRERGLQFLAKLAAPNRAAKTIKSLKGTMRLIRAVAPAEDILITNPIAQRGAMLDHPRLKELGIEVGVVANERIPNVQPGQAVLGIEQGAKMEQIKTIEIYDAWLTRVRTPARGAQTTDGKTITVYVLPDPAALENLSLVVQVWPKVEDAPFPIELTDIKLP